MAIIINIDSSLETASVSIAKDGIILQHLINDVQKQHATFIHSAVQKLTTELSIALADVDAIACTVGPGSYTGLRVGLATAKGFCYALNKPLIKIGTLEAMAHSMLLKHPIKDVYYCPMIDARRMEVYTALYNNELTEITAPYATVIDEDFCSEELINNKILFFGSGMEKYKKIAIKNDTFFAHIVDIYNSINILSYKRFFQNQFAPLAATAPLYAKDFYNAV